MGAALEAELRSMFERVQETVDKEVKLSRRGSRRKDVMNGDEAGADPHRMVSSSAESTSLEAVMQSRPSTSRSDRERLINEHESGLAKVAAREATARGRAEENLKRKLEIRRNKKKALDSGSHSSNLNLEAERLDGLRQRLISEHEVSLAQVAARRAVEQGRAEEELKRQLEIRRNKRKALESARRRIRGELINSDVAETDIIHQVAQARTEVASNIRLSRENSRGRMLPDNLASSSEPPRVEVDEKSKLTDHVLPSHLPRALPPLQKIPSGKQDDSSKMGAMLRRKSSILDQPHIVESDDGTQLPGSLLPVTPLEGEAAHSQESHVDTRKKDDEDALKKRDRDDAAAARAASLYRDWMRDEAKQVKETQHNRISSVQQLFHGQHDARADNATAIAKDEMSEIMTVVDKPPRRQGFADLAGESDHANSRADTEADASAVAETGAAGHREKGRGPPGPPTEAVLELFEDQIVDDSPSESSDAGPGSNDDDPPRPRRAFADMAENSDSQQDIHTSAGAAMAMGGRRLVRLGSLKALPPIGSADERSNTGGMMAAENADNASETRQAGAVGRKPTRAKAWSEIIEESPSDTDDET